LLDKLILRHQRQNSDLLEKKFHLYLMKNVTITVGNTSKIVKKLL